METDDGGELVQKFCSDFLNENNIKRFSRYTSSGSVFAERFNRTIGDLLKRSVFETEDCNWIDNLPTITKQYKNRIHSSTKLTPLRASLKNNEGFVYEIFLDKGKRISPKFKVHDLVKVADSKKNVFKIGYD